MRGPDTHYDTGDYPDEGLNDDERPACAKVIRQQSPDPDENNVDGRSGYGNGVYLSRAPAPCAVGVLNGFQEEIEVDVSIGTENRGAIQDCDEVNNPAGKRASNSRPGHSFRFRAAMASKTLHVELGVDVSKPDSAWVWFVREVRNHREACKSPDDSDDGVDHE